ncbi:MAG: hypothetical protein HRT89_20190 [Lentisphaeria bacterium]|nr:hypothetical protein [Lentisphaeria bacterium]NQZ70380.1 hypothetical protein [Lentisphaeria bacterium]
MVYEFDSAVGDSYYLPSGRIHGLGAGNLILSVEDEKGTAIKLDEDSYLDTENSIYTEDHEIIKLCVNSKNRSTPRNRSESSIVSRNRKLALVNNSPFVELEELRLVTMLHDRTNRNAFHFLIAIDGAINIKTAKGDLELQPGDNAFIPAAIGAYSVTPIGDVARVIRVIPKRL